MTALDNCSEFQVFSLLYVGDDCVGRLTHKEKQTEKESIEMCASRAVAAAYVHDILPGVCSTTGRLWCMGNSRFPWTS